MRRETGLLRDILECAIALVSEQTVVKRRVGLLQFRQFGAVGKNNVHQLKLRDNNRFNKKFQSPA
jgi:hypothetical protein